MKKYLNISFFSFKMVLINLVEKLESKSHPIQYWTKNRIEYFYLLSNLCQSHHWVPNTLFFSHLKEPQLGILKRRILYQNQERAK